MDNNLLQLGSKIEVNITHRRVTGSFGSRYFHIMSSD